MNDWQQKVCNLHKAIGHPAPERVTTDEIRRELRAKLIAEEAREVVEALGFGFETLGLDAPPREPDWPEVIDGLCDLLVVTLGTAVELGLDLEPFFAEVHRTNMLKSTGPVREDGKRLKPEGWEPPRIAELWELAQAVQREMTPEAREAQRRSFAYGNVKLSNPDVTREMVDEAAEKLREDEE